MIPDIRHKTITRLHRSWTQHLLILVLSLVLALSLGCLSALPKSEVAWQSQTVPSGGAPTFALSPIVFLPPSSEA